jgi:hypothetical protein
MFPTVARIYAFAAEATRVSRAEIGALGACQFVTQAA